VLDVTGPQGLSSPIQPNMLSSFQGSDGQRRNGSSPTELINGTKPKRQRGKSSQRA